MPKRTVLLTTIALSAFVLSGCGLLPNPAPSSNANSPKPTETVTETPVPEAAPLPADAVLGVSMRATSDTGAAVDIQLALLKPGPVDAPGSAAAVAATLAWCDGEVDQGVLEAQGGTSFATLAVTVTAVDGTPAWPSDLPLHLLPGEGGGASIATGPSAYQVQRPNDLNEEGFYVPHCAQDAFLNVPGTGSVYYGWGNDGTTLEAWLTANYGATFDAFGEPINPLQATLSNCTKTITDLGKSMGATDASFVDFFSDTQCLAISTK